MSAFLRASKKLYLCKSNAANLLLKSQNHDNRFLVPTSSYSSLSTNLKRLDEPNNHITIHHQHVRNLSQNNKGGFFGQVLENIKQEFEKNKEMKENLKKFREEAQKLEESDALKQARKKFVSFCYSFD